MASSVSTVAVSDVDADVLIERQVLDDSKRRRRLVVQRLGSYHEVLVKPLADDVRSSSSTSASPDTSELATSLVVLLADVSGSMEQSNCLAPLLSSWKALAKEYLLAGTHRVVFIPWANDSTSFHITDEASLNKAFDSFSQYFQNEKINWNSRTFPRLGFDQLEVILKQLGVNTSGSGSGSGSGSIQNVTLVFSTDGQFSQNPVDGYFGNVSHKVMTESYLTQLGAVMSGLGVPVSMQYLGILNDHVPDAKSLMRVFPACRYLFAATSAQIAPQTQVIIDALKEEVSTSNTLQVSIDGKTTNALLMEDMFMVNASIGKVLFPGAIQVVNSNDKVEVEAPSELFMLRKRCFDVLTLLHQLKEVYLSGGDILSSVKESDQQLTDVLQCVEKSGNGGAEKNRTRKYLFSVMRFKNELQQFAAKQLQASDVSNARLMLSKNQQLTLTLHNRYSNAIAKQITRNSDKVHEVTFETKMITTLPVTSASSEASAGDATASPSSSTAAAATTAASGGGGGGVDFVVTVSVQNGQVVPGGPSNIGSTMHTYTSKNVPTMVAHDETIDFITTDTFAEVYANGDTRCQCVLIKKQPGESEFHTPSHIKLDTINAQVSMSTIMSTIQQRVEVEGYASLFTRPFTGTTAVEVYNAVLPTYSPNFEANVRWKLRPLLGYIIGGHELAFTSHCIDIYVPAIVSAWSQYFENKSKKYLEDAMLLTLAFGKIKRWLRVGNAFDPKKITPEQNVHMFLNGDNGSHAFPNYWEPVIYAMLATRNVRRSIPMVSAVAVSVEASSTASACSSSTMQPHPNPESKEEQEEQNNAPEFKEADELESALDDLSLLQSTTASVENSSVSSTPFKDLDWSAFRTILMGEQICKMSRYKSDLFKPMVQEIIIECGLTETPDFTLLPPFTGESDAMKKLVSEVVSTSQLELASRLLTVAPLLDASMWSHVETHYTIPANLHDLIQDALMDNSKRMPLPTVPEIVAWVCLAHDFPTNSTRRGLTKTPHAVLQDKVQTILNTELSEERRRLFYKRRLDRFVETHGWFPLVMTEHQLAWLRNAVQRPESDTNCDAFVREFQEQFSMHLGHEETFVKVPGVDYRARLEANLRCLWQDRRNVLGQHGTLLTVSVTSLPKNRCGHPLCPEFLRHNRALEQDHLKDLGLDLHPGDEFRVWYPSMHMRCQENIHRTKADFVQVMMEGARRYCGAPHQDIIRVMFESHWDMFHQ